MPGEDGTLAVLQAMLTTFSDVLAAMDRRLASMEAAVRSFQSDEEQARELRQALHNLGRVERIEEDLGEMRAAVSSLQGDQAQAEQLRQALHNLRRVEQIEQDMGAMRAALLNHPATTVYDAVAHLTRQVDTLVAQPGPGPAMAMVAAGLSERFEQRTDSVVTLLQEHAELMHGLTEQVQEAMEGLVMTVQARQAGLDALLDTVRAVATTIEGMGARIDDARDRVEAVFRAGEDLPTAVESLRELEEAIRGTAETIRGHSVAGLTDVVRDEAELLGQRLAAISVSVDALGRLLVSHTEETGHSLGRRASEAGRRLVADLGLAGKPKERVANQAPPPPMPPPRPAPPPPPPPRPASPAPPPPPRPRKRKAAPPPTNKPPPRRRP